MRVMENRFPQRGCGVSSLQSFKSHQDVILGTLLEVTLLEQGLEQVDPYVPSQPNQSAILLFISFVVVLTTP